MSGFAVDHNRLKFKNQDTWSESEPAIALFDNVE